MNAIPYHTLIWSNHHLYELISLCKPLFGNLRHTIPCEHNVYDLENHQLTPYRRGDLMKLYLIIDVSEDLNMFQLFPLIMKYTLRLGSVELTYTYQTLMVYYIMNRLEIRTCRYYNSDKKCIMYKYTIELPHGMPSERSIPILPMQYANLKLDFKTKERVVVVNNVRLHEQIWKKLPKDLAIMILKFYNDEFSKVNIKVGCDHFYLHTYERRQIAQAIHMFEWERFIILGTGKSNTSIALSNYTFAKYIIFYIHSNENYNPDEF